ncbi:hypothetical protein, partial [Mycobacterium helveticum]|uniref:hypothetical protein n=1 Tax=Mycobacterium helveticum TaxID=2592811 RepID=UPI001AEFC44B
HGHTSSVSLTSLPLIADASTVSGEPHTQRRYNAAGEPYAWLVRSTAFINLDLSCNSAFAGVVDAKGTLPQG